MKGCITNLATELVLNSAVPSKELYGMCFKTDQLGIKRVDINPLASASHWSREVSLIFNYFAVQISRASALKPKSNKKPKTQAGIERYLFNTGLSPVLSGYICGKLSTAF